MNDLAQMGLLQLMGDPVMRAQLERALWANQREGMQGATQRGMEGLGWITPQMQRMQDRNAWEEHLRRLQSAQTGQMQQQQMMRRPGGFFGF